MAGPEPSFEEFYRSQIQKIRTLESRRLMAVVGVAIILIGVVFGLRSPWYVVGYVALLFLATSYGSRKLGIALHVTKAAEEHLLGFAAFLNQPHSREEFLAEIERNVSPNDDSNVPEAIRGYCSGRQDGDRARAVAYSAFVRAVAELNFAHFLRTALVLGGLFGTVLFFAIVLGGHDLLGGDLAVLFPGLRGALASTLTGILGSIALGWIGSSIDRLVEEATWETESFVGGPVSRALAREDAGTEVHDEADLWTALRQEVTLLRKDTVNVYKTLADDAAAYAKSLEAVSQQITNLPPIQVPPQLANLQEVIARFAVSTDSLDRTVSTLVQSVATLGLVAPTQMLGDLAALKQMTADGRSATSGAFERVEASLRSAEERVHDAVGRLATSEQLLETRGRLESGLHDVGTQTTVGVQAVAEVRADLTRGLEDLSAQSSASIHAAADLRGELTTVLENNAARTIVGLDGVSGRLDELQSGLSNIRGVLGPATVSAEQEPPAFTADAERALMALSEEVPRGFDQALSQITAARDELSRVRAAITPLRSVYAWHQRASQAPLMRFLLLPFRRSRARYPAGMSGSQGRGGASAMQPDPPRELPAATADAS